MEQLSSPCSTPASTNSTNVQYNRTNYPSSFIFSDREIEILLYFAWIINLSAIILILGFVVVLKCALSRGSYLTCENCMNEDFMRHQKKRNKIFSQCFRTKSHEEDYVKQSPASHSRCESYGSIQEINARECNIAITNTEEELEIVPENDTNSQCSPSPNWEQINQERKQRLEEALKRAEEIKERRQRQREELALERKKKMHEMIATLISSLAHPLYEETRKFNEWIEQPD